MYHVGELLLDRVKRELVKVEGEGALYNESTCQNAVYQEVRKGRRLRSVVEELCEGGACREGCEVYGRLSRMVERCIEM